MPVVSAAGLMVSAVLFGIPVDLRLCVARACLVVPGIGCPLPVKLPLLLRVAWHHCLSPGLALFPGCRAPGFAVVRQLLRGFRGRLVPGCVVRRRTCRVLLESLAFFPVPAPLLILVAEGFRLLGLPWRLLARKPRRPGRHAGPGGLPGSLLLGPGGRTRLAFGLVLGCDVAEFTG